MKYKLSKYNHFIENDYGDLLLYNTLRGIKSMAKVKREDVNEFYRIVENKDIRKLEEDGLEKKLIDRGYLVLNSENEDELIKEIFDKSINDNCLSMVISPTEQCNLRCVYCCENFKYGKMSDQIQESIIRYVENNIHKYSGVDINWFGGEPILAMDVIRNISKKLIDICKKNKKQYKAFVVTNGTLLNHETFEELYKLKVLSYQISVDATKAIHDAQRITIDGKGSFDKIIKNLEEIRDSKSGKYATILILTNCSKISMNNLHEYKKFFYEKFGEDKRFGFSLQRIMDLGGDRVHVYRDNIFEFEDMNNIYDELRKHNEYKLNYLYTVFLEPGSSICYAAKKNSYVIGSTGKIYRCEHEYQMNRDNFIGEFDLEGNMIICQDKDKKWHGKFNNCGSKECVYKPLCGGEDCIKNRVKNETRNNSICGYENCHFGKKSLSGLLKLLDSESDYFQQI